MSSNTIPISKRRNWLKVDVLLVVIFMILVSGVLYYLFKSMEARQLLVNANDILTSNETNLLLAITDNTINKIYNIVVVTTIFFTVTVSSVTVFQFFKVRESNEVKKEMENHIATYKKETAELGIKLAEYELKLQDVQNEYFNKLVELDDMKQLLEKKSLEQEIEILFIKAKDASEKRYYDSDKIRMDCYKRILDISEKFPNLITEERLGIVYNNLALLQPTYDSKKAYFEKALDRQRNTPEIITIKNNIGDMEKTYGNLNGAVEAYQQAYSLKQTDFTTLVNLIIALNARNSEGDIELAYKYCQELMAINKNDALLKLEKLKSSGLLENLVGKYENYFLILLKHNV